MSSSSSTRVQAIPVVDFLGDPIVITTAILPCQDSQTLFIATSQGIIYMVHPDETLEVFLDISDLILPNGLYGLAFHPKFSKNRRFYLYYGMQDSGTGSPQAKVPNPNHKNSLTQVWSNPEQYDHVNTLEEWVLKENGPICARTLLNLKWPFENNNGLDVLRWHNHRLVLLTGDGGLEYDPFHLAQDDMSPHGKILLIDVEIQPWHYSKNPEPISRFHELDSIRKESVRMVSKGLGDPSSLHLENMVGHVSDHSKILLFKKAHTNLGWPAWNGKIPTTCLNQIVYYEEALDYQPVGLKFYHHTSATIGGFVYQGEMMPNLQNHYIYADRSGQIWQTDPEWDQPEKLYNLNCTVFAIGTNNDRSRILIGTSGRIYELVSK